MATEESKEPPAPRDPVEAGFEASFAKEREWSEAGQKLAQCNRNEKIIEEKENQIRNVIQANYARIKEAEKELQDLQLQLKSTVGPKRSLLEMLRKKIEAQNNRVMAQRAKVASAQEVLKQAEAALKIEEEAKERLCQDLNLVVQQSAHAQIDKLEQLTSRLEQLSAGVGSEVTASKTSQETAAPAAEAAPRDAGGACSNPFAADGTAAVESESQTAQQQKPEVSSGTSEGTNNPFETAQQAVDLAASEEEAKRRQEHQQMQQREMARAAKAARQKHVAIKKNPPKQAARQSKDTLAQNHQAPKHQQKQDVSSLQQSPFSGFDT